MRQDRFVNVSRFLPEAAAKVPDHRALAIPQGRGSDGAIIYQNLSFKELSEDVDRAVHWLRGRGIRQGTLTLLMVKPGLELIQLCFALFRMGAVPVVIDPGMGLKNFLNCVRTTQPEALVGIPLAHAVKTVFRKPFASIQHTAKVPKGAKFQKILEGMPSDPADPALTQASDLAAVLFTSGSTGAPKGVCYEHSMFEAQVEMIRGEYDIQPGEVDLPMLPIFALFNPAMGMTTVVPEMNPSRPATVDPAKIVQAIRQNEVTSSFGSPVLWTKIGRYCTENHIQLPSIKRILMAGAPVSPAIMRMFESILSNGEIHTPYGATESLPVSTISAKRVLSDTWSKTERGAGTCVGRAFKEIDTRIIPLNASPVRSMDGMPEVAVGEIGELCVRGPVVTQRYNALPEATAKAKIKDPDGGPLWHRMGDMAYLDEQGEIWFCGRMAERVETQPGNIMYTDPCEAIANQVPGVYRSALIGLGKAPNQTPAIVIEPEERAWPKSEADKHTFTKNVLEKLSQHAHTQNIRKVFFEKRFPVDVRHNAKIHRLTLARKFTKL
ncbi:MAG: fatty acid CoA ligase family protein [Opitutales bacterium]